MFDFFKKNRGGQPLDAKGLREAILQLVKETLQQLDGGEGNAVRALSLFLNAGAGERFVYEAAVYSEDTGRLQEDIRRIADNFALNLPPEWKLEVIFVDELPAGAVRREGLKAGLVLRMASILSSERKSGFQGLLRILKGKAEQEEYVLEPDSKRINIGRGKNVQVNDGSFRVNQIAFPEDAAFEGNKYISRQHAHIVWDDQSGSFRFFADEGGVPPGNKTRIRSAKDGTADKLNSTQIGHPLKEGDQIMLADVAVLEFTMISI